MREVFVDTSAWVALTLEDERHHKSASSIYPELLQSSSLITTNFILAEVYILLRRSLGTKLSLAFLHFIHSSPRVEVVRVDEVLEREGERILGQYSDQDFSYTDAVSFALMGKRNIAEAFAFDRHFLIAGFALVPTLRNKKSPRL